MTDSELYNVLIGLPHFCFALIPTHFGTKGVISIPTSRERNLVLTKTYCYALHLRVFLRIVTEPDKHNNQFYYLPHITHKT